MKNKHGVEVVFETVAFKGAEIPVMCMRCVFFDRGERGEVGEQIGFSGCKKGRFFPTKKGTCNLNKDRGY